MSAWAGIDGELALEVAEQSQACLNVYREDPSRVEQDAAIETSTAQGGYGRKQLYELIQNGADALQDAVGRIHVALTKSNLYVANQGKPLSPMGVRSLLASHLSRKRGEEIGRFGLGFKSVVAVSDQPQVFSRSVSFEFNREYARELISAIAPGAPTYPMLRTATPVDPAQAASQDEVLLRMMRWATTVVRIPLKSGYEDIAADIKSFPASFLLFSQHVSNITFDIFPEKFIRKINLTKKPSGTLILTDGPERTEWFVASRHHRPSRRALEDAGELAQREAIHVWWAVPTRKRTAIGQFWAFFPTEDQTTLAGIVNAPWKMGDDRRNLLPGAFNKEILTEVLPDLVASSWSKMIDPEDPASILDILPARGRENRSWADGILNEPVFQKVAASPSIPDTAGSLRLASEIRLAPKELNAFGPGADELRQAWYAIEPSPPGWAHPSTERTAERRAKADRLASGGLAGRETPARAAIKDWLEAPCLHAPTVPASAGSIDLAARLVASPLENDARRARIILLEDDSVAPARPGQVFVRSSPDDEGFSFIHPALANLPTVIASLKRLNIRVLDRAGELRAALAKATRSEDINWATAWSIIHQMTSKWKVAEQILREELRRHGQLEHHLRVRNRAGNFVPLGSVFLPGPIVSIRRPEDRDCCVDIDFHRSDAELLKVLGAVDRPIVRSDAPSERWLDDYDLIIRQDFAGRATGAKPQPDRLVTHRSPVPWPLEPLARLSGQARATLTHLALTQVGQPWRVEHASNSGYGKRSYKNPVFWLVQAHGRFRTPFGLLAPQDCLRAFVGSDPDVLPIVDLPDDIASRLEMPSEPAGLTVETWAKLTTSVLEWSDLGKIASFYAWAVHFADPPGQVAVQAGDRIKRLPPADVAIATTEAEFAALVEQSTPVLLMTDGQDANAALARWHMEDATSLLDQELSYVRDGEPEALVDRYPKLRLWLDHENFEIRLQLCTSLSMVTSTRKGTRSEPTTHALDAGTIFTTQSTEHGILQSVSDLFELRLTRENIRDILEAKKSAEVAKLVAQLRNAASDDERLAILVPPDTLRSAIPVAALEALEQEGRELSPIDLAAAARAVHGVSVLKHFRSVLDERGLNPPVQWTGTSRARHFLGDLGFSIDLAGFSAPAPPAEFLVDGPADLGDLHPYQSHVTARIRGLLRKRELSRGMVSLPTGAGKTRVAVQALVEAIRDDNLHGPIVWIAQSEELCEQAVGAWAYIWRALGPSIPLSIGRLWSGNQVAESAEGIQLLVATPHKLDNLVGNSDYDWLTEPSVVIIDEAHTSVAPRYTKVLEWLGRSSRGEGRRAFRPLLGLTATPFRNTNREETQRLVNRYEQNRLDEGAFDSEDHYGELQKMGVLAQVRHELLVGSDVSFTNADMAEIEQFKRLPRSIENRLGSDRERNLRIVESIAALPKDWPVLLFATSVENSAALAALLSHRGIPSVAISGETEAPVRRHSIKQFKSGEIRVLTNYNVLTQGFDAPAVRAVYVTRPTFSPNNYQQMIGRGLRGPLNGGTEEVLIVNVEDNLHQYGERLAFREFEYLWDARHE